MDSVSVSEISPKTVKDVLAESPVTIMDMCLKPVLDGSHRTVMDNVSVSEISHKTVKDVLDES